MEMGVLLCVLVTDSKVAKPAVGYEHFTSLKRRLRGCQNWSIKV